MQNILEGIAVVCVNLGHEAEENIDASIITIVVGYMQRCNQSEVAIIDLLFLLEEALCVTSPFFIYHCH